MSIACWERVQPERPRKEPDARGQGSDGCGQVKHANAPSGRLRSLKQTPGGAESIYSSPPLTCLPFAPSSPPSLFSPSPGTHRSSHIHPLSAMQSLSTCLVTAALFVAAVSAQFQINTPWVFPAVQWCSLAPSNPATVEVLLSVSRLSLLGLVVKVSSFFPRPVLLCLTCHQHRTS